MAGNRDVTVSVQSELLKIVADLDKLTKSAKGISDVMKKSGEDVGKSVEEQTKKVQNSFNQMRSFGRRVADNLKQDFRSLVSINAIGESLKLSNVFKGSVAESISLSDQIRKLGRTFGIAQNDFASFQSKLTKGLGEIGLSSDAAANALKGLADTPVRGQENLLGYAKAAGQLASIGDQKGQEGAIAGGISRVITARGGNPNDLNQVNAVAEDLRRAKNATGKAPTEILKAMEDLFSGMAKDLRGKIGTRGLTNLAAAATVAGPNSTKFLEEFLSKSPIARKALEAQGFKGVFTDKGIDTEKFKSASKSVLGRVGGDPRLAAQTLGISEEAAEGFVRLSESLDKVKAAQDGIERSTGDLNTQYRQSMGLSEGFNAALNRVKGVFAAPIAYATHGVSSMLGAASESTAGAVGVVAGGATLAALLAGVGMRGVGKALGGMGGGLAGAAATEAVTGRQVVPVYVTNPGDIGGGGMAGAAGGMMGRVGGMAGKLGLVGAAGAAGYGVGSLIEGGIEKYSQGKTPEGFEGSGLERLFFKLDKVFGGETSAQFMRQQHRLEVELKSKDLKQAKPHSRGSSQ